MDKKTKQISGDNYLDVMNGFSDGKEEDQLTDPGTVAAAQGRDERDRAIDHGKKLLSAREKRGFTLQEISKNVGIEEALLAQVEQGDAFLPLGQLIKLTSALSLRIQDVISTGQEPFTIVRSDERESFTRFGKEKRSSHGYEYESLAAQKSSRKMEPFVVTLYPASSDDPSAHEGQEFVYVLEGEVEVWIDGTREILKPGDAGYYESKTTHLVKAHGENPAKILAVLIG